MDFATLLLQQRVEKAFTEARTLFFPRWDVSNKWKIETKSGLDDSAYCSSEMKAIFFSLEDVEGMVPDGLLALIIHEICHDVATAYHKEGWAERMEKAAQKANALNRPELAKQIRDSAFSGLPLADPWAEKWAKIFDPKTH